MAKPLTKSQTIEHLSKKTGFTKKDTKEFLEELTLLAYKQAKNGFTIPGIGKLVLVKRKARMGRNPQTGESIRIKASKVVKLRVAKACKDAVVPPKK
jgi:DNA-binding protein HU-beta